MEPFSKIKDRLLRKIKEGLGPAKTSIIVQRPPEQVAPSVPQPLNPAPAPVSSRPSSAQPTVSDNPPGSDGPDLWTRAYDIFQKRRPELMADYKRHLASLHGNATASADLSSRLSVESIVNKLWEDRAKKQWRVSLLDTDIKIREQVERLAKFFLWSDQVVKTAVSAQPYAALAWSGVSLLLPLLISGTEQNEAMLKGFNSIGDLQMYWRICEETYLRSEHQRFYLSLIEPLVKLYSHMIEYQALVICHLSTAQLSRAWRDVAGSNDWAATKGRIDELDEDCRNRFIPAGKQEEIRQKWDDQRQEMQKSRFILDEIRGILQQTERRYEDKKKRELLQQLESTYEDDKDTIPLRVSGTCDWFFRDMRFRQWRDNYTSCLLWISAGPGCGKSVLSRALVDERLLSTKVTMSTVCYFFFKNGDEGRTHATDALCAILHQLFLHGPAGSLIEHALPSSEQYPQTLAQNLSELWRVLLKCADSPDAGEIICVLDGLDECNADGRRQLIDKLKDFYCQPQGSPKSFSKLKFLITSRPYDDLEMSFRTFSNTTAYLRFDGDDKSAQISNEINLVIDARVDEIAREFEEDDRRTISERLKRMEHRTYLWLHLTFHIIEQSPSQYGKRSDVEALLSDLPSEVSEAYEKILGRSKNQVYTETLLQILLAATRPLTLDEANIALTLALQRKRFISHTALEAALWPRKLFKSTVKNLCGLFINVYDSKLSFIHQTAREFLVHPERQGTWKGRFNMPKSHSTISRSCLQYILLPDTAAAAENKSIDNQQYPFLYYAATNWPVHNRMLESMLGGLGKCHSFLRNLDKASEKAPRDEASKRFKDNKVKVAIIGNGVDKIRSPVRNNIAKGISFVMADRTANSNRTLPWWMVSDPHGTHIAALIHKVNPFCRLYIARVGRGCKEFLPEDVAKAVNWAIANEVDIISINWPTKIDDVELREAIKKAVHAATDSQTSPILVFCPLTGEGVDTGKVSPADYENTITVAATDKSGHLRSASQDSFDILVPVVDIEADGPVYMEGYAKDFASSIATALASGIASLALLLLRIFNDDQAALKEFLRKYKIMQVFAKMGGGQSGIELGQLFGDFCSSDIASRWATANFA